MPGMSPEDTHRLYTRILFDRYFDLDVPEALRHVAEYVEYLADSISPAELSTSAPKDLLSCFESVFLWVQQTLTAYPDAVREQVASIVTTNDLCQLFAILADLDESTLSRLRRSRLSRLQFRIFAAIGLELEPPEPYIPLSRKRLYDARLALRRAAQILTYASSLRILPSDDLTSGLEEHYDPSLIDRHRILALLHVLRSGINALPPDSPAHQLSAKLDDLETELGRPRIRWGTVIAYAFVVFGFLSDLHTVSPSTYDALFRTASAILHVLQYSSPHQQPHAPLLPPSPTPQDIALPASTSGPPKPDDA